MKRMFFAIMAMAVVVILVASAQAGERDLLSKSSVLVAAEIDGLGAPDAKFVIASLDVGGKGSVGRIAKDSPVGDQGVSQVVQRSNGCSTGCSTGCSVGCSVGCSIGCR